MVEGWGRKQENPLWRTVEEEVEEYASLGEKGTSKMGGQLREEEREEVLTMLEANSDRFAYKVEDLGGYTGEPMGVPLVDEKVNIWSSPHKLSRAEWDYVEENCEKLEKLGIIRESNQRRYASATVVVRKRDENGDYTNLRQCGDYRPLNLQTEQDRYPLPFIDEILQSAILMTLWYGAGK